MENAADSGLTGEDAAVPTSGATSGQSKAGRLLLSLNGPTNDNGSVIISVGVKIALLKIQAVLFMAS